MQRTYATLDEFTDDGEQHSERSASRCATDPSLECQRSSQVRFLSSHPASQDSNRSPTFRTNGTVALAGGLYGALLFVVNFLIIAEVWLDQFQMPNKPFELAIHIVFGHVLAVAFYSSGTRRGEPFIAVNT